MNKKRVDTTTGYLTKGKEFRCNFDSTMLEFFDSDTLLQSAAHKLIVMIIMIELKVNKFQNENLKLSHCPKYERKNLKNSTLCI